MTKATPDKLSLEAVKRDIFGKKLRKMRKEGKIPANIYGPNFKSLSITVSGKDFGKVFKVAGETGVVYLKVDKEEIPVLIKNIQMHPVIHLLLHVDFRKVDLKQKVETQVPIKVIGESPAVKEKAGVLLTQTSEITVEALPQDIPHEVEVDISKLVEIGDEIKVADLTKSNKYEIKDEADKLIVQVIAHKEESLAPETAAAAPEVITEKPAEGEEGVEPAPAEEGEKPAEAGQQAQEKGEKGEKGKNVEKVENKPVEKAPQPQKQPKEEKK